MPQDQHDLALDVELREVVVTVLGCRDAVPREDDRGLDMTVVGEAERTEVLAGPGDSRGTAGVDLEDGGVEIVSAIGSALSSSS